MTKPIHSERVGRVEAAVWDKEIELSNGGKFMAYSVTAVEKYKDSEGKIKNTSSISERNLGSMVKAVGRAWDWIIFNKHREAKR